MKLIRLELTLIIVETNALFRVRVPPPLRIDPLLFPDREQEGEVECANGRVEERLLLEEEFGEEFSRRPTEDHELFRRRLLFLSSFEENLALRRKVCARHTDKPLL